MNCDLFQGRAGRKSRRKEFEVMNELNKAATDDEREVWQTLIDELPVPN